MRHCTIFYDSVSDWPASAALSSPLMLGAGSRLTVCSPWTTFRLNGRGASSGGVFGLAKPPQGCQCGRAHCRSHSPHRDGESRRQQKRRSGHPGNAYRLWAGIPDLLCASRNTDCDPVVRWRQAHATAGHQTGSENSGDIVIPKTTRFDAADYLDTEERQVAYIAEELESGDADFVRDALGLVARARGMGGIAKKAGLNRESLYKALGETGNAEFSTLMRIVRALGLTLSARPVASGQTSKRRRVA